MGGAGNRLSMDEAERTAAVCRWQTAYGMAPRADSALTRLYARGDIDWTADEVARELVATDFVYSHTLYGEVIEDFMRAVCARLRREHKLSWTAAWRIVRFYAPLALKCMCVDACGVRIPELMHVTLDA